MAERKRRTTGRELSARSPESRHRRERHLKRLLTNYVTYYHEDRTHLGLNKGTPNARVLAVDRGRVVGEPRLGGVRHWYDRAA